jgi:dienelactone hydrolase
MSKILFTITILVCATAVDRLQALPSQTTAVEIHAGLARSAIDSPVNLSIIGLKPHAIVRVEADEHQFSFPMRASAVFAADAAGTVHVARQAPISGDYSGTDPMGLFWSMRPVDESQKFEFNPSDELKDFDVRFAVYEGTRRIATSTIHRYILSASVLHREIDRDGLVAAYFAPRDAKRHPGIIVLNGSQGGLERDTAAVLARHGYCTLALAYFGTGSLPKFLGNIPIETVERARKLLVSMPEVDKDRIAVVGFSKGAELALVAASHLPSLKAAIVYAPSSVVFAGLTPSNIRESSWTYQGEGLPFADGHVPQALDRGIDRAFADKRPVAFTPWYLAKLNGASPASRIAVEQIRGPVLLIAGGDDQLWPSSVMAKQVFARLRTYRHKYADKLLVYSSAGHAINYPFVPTRHTVTAGPLALGGSAGANARADADSWVHVLAFLRSAFAAHAE